MSVAVVTGSAGLIGSEAVVFFAGLGLDIVGIDNDMRSRFFGVEASTEWRRRQIKERLGARYCHYEIDIRNREAVRDTFKRYAGDVALVIHTAAQPSHDWAATDPCTDFSVNAVGTLNLLETTRELADEAVFIFTSTNKVYGDSPNRLPLVELDDRWEIEPGHRFEGGIDESMTIDDSLHSVFGASKAAADIMTQEYGRYFGLKTSCFRGGCLTGPNHSGTELHGFLAYLMKCVVQERKYTVFGYEGKQVRDNIHSSDLIRAFNEVFKAPRQGAVYNIGGGRHSNCSMLEAIRLSEEISGRKLDWTYSDHNRRGDHIWWISDNGSFERHYPSWELEYDIPGILEEIHEAMAERVTSDAV